MPRPKRASFPPVDEQLALLKRGAAEIIGEDELARKLERSRAERRPLVIKAGFDPTAPDLHLGHTVLLRKMRHFQQLGHEVVFLIGDFTGQIGDPSGQSEQRKPMTPAAIKQNAKTYQAQVFKVLDAKRTITRGNSEWFGKMAAADLAKLCGHFTVARVIERDDFQKRLHTGSPISMLELMYPILQAYDSVMLKADIELGGSDQKFNLLMGRRLQPDFGQEPQVVLMMPLLEGTDGAQKMSKSFGNAIGLHEPPEEVFGKTMSLPDTLTLKYAELLTDLDLTSLRSAHPMDAKKRLAHELVRLYHGEASAGRAQTHFKRVFQERQAPEEIPAIAVTLSRPTKLVDLLDAAPVKAALAKTAPSKSAFRRLIQQGGLRLDGARVDNVEAIVEPGRTYLLQLGRRHFFRLETQPT